MTVSRDHPAVTRERFPDRVLTAWLLTLKQPTHFCACAWKRWPSSSLLRTARYSSMAAISAGTLLKEPRAVAFWSDPRRRPPPYSQDDPVATKWSRKRGWTSSQASTLACRWLCVRARSARGSSRPSAGRSAVCPAQVCVSHYPGSLQPSWSMRDHRMDLVNPPSTS